MTRTLGKTMALRGKPGSQGLLQSQDIFADCQRSRSQTAAVSYPSLTTLRIYRELHRESRCELAVPKERHSGSRKSAFPAHAPFSIYEGSYLARSRHSSQVAQRRSDRNFRRERAKCPRPDLQVKAGRAREEMRMRIADDQTAVDQRPVRKTTCSRRLSPLFLEDHLGA